MLSLLSLYNSIFFSPGLIEKLNIAQIRIFLSKDMSKQLIRLEFHLHLVQFFFRSTRRRFCKGHIRVDLASEGVIIVFLDGECNAGFHSIVDSNHGVLLGADGAADDELAPAGCEVANLSFVLCKVYPLEIATGARFISQFLFSPSAMISNPVVSNLSNALNPVAMAL